MPASISITTEDGATTRVVVVNGEVDLATAPELDKAVDFSGDIGVLVLDLGGVAFMDSTGLRSLIAAQDAAESKRKALRIVAGDAVTRLVELTGLQHRLALFADRAAATADG